MTGSSECLLDADRPPTIHIKTDRHGSTSPNKTWTRLVFRVQKNMLLSICMVLAISITGYIFIFNPPPTPPSLSSSEKLFQSLREKFIHPPHQDKLRANPSFEYLDPDNYLHWDRVDNATTRVKAAFVVVTREEEVYRLHATMLDVERHFNHGAYPWVIIGHKVFSRHFRELITSTTKAPVSFGLAPSIEWQEPYWIDIRRAEQSIKVMARKDLSRGESMHWRKMTRYNAGFIAFHPLLKELEFYWKVQPGSRYHCDIPHDPFQRMKDEGKKLSFALSMTENHEYIYDFEATVKDFIRKNKSLLMPTKKSIYRSLLNDHSVKDDTLGEYAGGYSNCMIYNNFMIVSLDFLRSKEYNLFFNELDASGGFFYQKWGDSFPQTFAAAFFLTNKEISYDDIKGYAYDQGAICPLNINEYVELKCTCNPSEHRVRQMDHCTPKIIRSIEGNL